MEQKIKKIIPGMFGNNDSEFAIHYYDKIRAIKALNFCFFNNICLDDFIHYCKEHLESKGCSKKHIIKQVRRIKTFDFNPYNKSMINSCWLISRETINDISILDGERILNGRDVINVIDVRKSSEFIVNCINFYISSINFNLNQKIVFQQRKKSNNFDFVKTGLCSGLIVCKYMDCNIIGRVVKNVRVIKTKISSSICITEVIYSQIKKMPENVHESCLRLMACGEQ